MKTSTKQSCRTGCVLPVQPHRTRQKIPPQRYPVPLYPNEPTLPHSLAHSRRGAVSVHLMCSTAPPTSRYIPTLWCPTVEALRLPSRVAQKRSQAFPAPLVHECVPPPPRQKDGPYSMGARGGPTRTSQHIPVAGHRHLPSTRAGSHLHKRRGQSRGGDPPPWH